MNKPEHKKYLIETIQDVANCVTLENIDNFIIDFEGVLRAMLLLESASKDIDKFVDVKFPSFVWIDDNKHEIGIDLSSKPNA